MTPTELKELRGMLENQRYELEGTKLGRDVLTLELMTPDELERLQQASRQDFAGDSLKRPKSHLHEVERALGRISDGSFGLCVNCDDEIGLNSLKAVPWARYCPTCH